VVVVGLALVVIGGRGGVRDVYNCIINRTSPTANRSVTQSSQPVVNTRVWLC